MLDGRSDSIFRNVGLFFEILNFFFHLVLQRKGVFAGPIEGGILNVSIVVCFSSLFQSWMSWLFHFRFYWDFLSLLEFQTKDSVHMGLFIKNIILGILFHFFFLPLSTKTFLINTFYFLKSHHSPTMRQQSE